MSVSRDQWLRHTRAAAGQPAAGQSSALVCADSRRRRRLKYRNVYGAIDSVVPSKDGFRPHDHGSVAGGLEILRMRVMKSRKPARFSGSKRISL